MNQFVFLLFVIFVLPGSARDVKNWRRSLENNNYPLDVIEDATLEINELIAKYGYPVEIHYVTTEDGYILEVHRIRKDGGQPYILQHGLLDSSITFVIMGPKVGLAYLLWDLGYDVWLGNARGNRYSRNHTTLNPDDAEFWQFSWHEIGYYDLPAIIDYTLNLTSFKKLYYTGHSQGSTSFWVMGSKRPQYNDKIILMQALGPAAYMKHATVFLYSVYGRFSERLLRSFAANEVVLPDNFKYVSCSGDESMANMTIEMLFNLVGKNLKEFNRTKLPLICANCPSGAATNQVLHYDQLIKSGKFREYDFGPRKNHEKYGSAVPPDYNLSRVTAPVVLHYSWNDRLVHPTDIKKLHSELGNPVGMYEISKFTHMDFIWAIHVRSLLYNRLIQIMNDFSNGNLTNAIE